MTDPTTSEVPRAGTTVRFRGADVFVREVGQGPPLLLINGLGAHTAMWAALEHTLRDFRLLQFDLPGAGQSELSRRQLSISDLAELATVVLDHFDVERAHVLGYSMGGVVAQQLAHDAPERVERLVLLATTPGRGAFQGGLKARINIATPVRYLSPFLYAKTIGSLVGGRARHDAAWVAEQGLLRLQHMPSWRGYFSQLRSIVNWSAFEFLRDVPHATLILAGDDDPLIPVINGMILSYLLPNSRLLVVRSEGHLMMMDQDSRTHPAIREFLTADDLETTGIWHHAAPVDARELKIALAGAKDARLPWGRDARLRRRWLHADEEDERWYRADTAPGDTDPA